MELRIASDGTITAMHTDELVGMCSAVGEMVIRRASHVEPDGLKWGVWTASGQDTGQRFDTRFEALTWEQEHFWEML